MTDPKPESFTTYNDDARETITVVDTFPMRNGRVGFVGHGRADRGMRWRTGFLTFAGHAVHVFNHATEDQARRHMQGVVNAAPGEAEGSL
jgi:hypothetical protein